MFELHPQLAKDCLHVADLALSRILLMNDCRYPWLIQVPMLNGITEVIDLTPQQQQQLWQESALLSQLLKLEFNPDKLNVAALGNMVPQLHIHHIARFKQDPAWPAPVWGHSPAQAYDEQELKKLVEILQHKLKG